MESYGTSNFTFKYGIHTISIDYLCGHGPDSTVKIISLEIIFDIFGYLFKKRPFLKCRVGKMSLELNSQNLGNNNFNKNQFFDSYSSGDNLTNALKARQRIKYQKQNPQKLRIHHQFDQNQDLEDNKNEGKNHTRKDLAQDDIQHQQTQNFDQNQQQNGFIHDSMKSNHNPLERWIARRLLGFFLAMLVRSAQIDSGLLTLKIGSFSLNIKDISVAYHRSATSITSNVHFNEISLISDKKLPFKLSQQSDTNDNDITNENDDNENDNNDIDKNNDDMKNEKDTNTNMKNINNTIENDENDQIIALLRIPHVSMTISSDTQSFKYFLGGMFSQFCITIDEINVDYSDGQMNISAIQAQMFTRKDLSSKTDLDISQILILFPVIDLNTKTLSATVNDISLSLESGKFVSGPILVTRNEQPFFNSHSMKYRKGKIDFEYLDATISTPLIIDISLFKRLYSVFSEEIENNINRFKNLVNSRSSYYKFDSTDSSNANLKVNAMSDSTNNSLFSSTDSVNDNNYYNNNDESSSINNSSEIMSGFDDQSEIQNEIEIDIEKYDQKENDDNNDYNDHSDDESRNEFESAYDMNEDSWTQSSESSSNYKFSVENDSFSKSKASFKSFRSRKKLRKKKPYSSLYINAPTAILRFALSDNHIMIYNLRQFSYSNNLITAKSFTLDASFNDSQHLSSSLNEELKYTVTKLAFIENTKKDNDNSSTSNNKEMLTNYQSLLHRFCECHHASFNFTTPLIAFKCISGNFFLTNEFAEASFIQEFLALFRFLHNQTKLDQIDTKQSLLLSSENNNNNNDDEILEEEEDKEEENPLTKYCFSFDVHKFGLEMKTSSLVSKIHRSNEAKRLAIEGLQIRQEKAIQIMNANLSNDSNLNQNSTFSTSDFEQTSRKMLFDLYKSAIEKIEYPKGDDLFYVHSKDFHFSFDGPKIKNKKEGIDELKRTVRFTKKKKDVYDKIKKRNKVENFDEKYEKYTENDSNLEEFDMNSNLNNDNLSTDDIFENKDIEFDKDEFDEVVSKIGSFDCGLLNLNANSITISSPRIGTLMTFKVIKTSGTMMIMKQKALKNDDYYHFPIHCDQKSIEFLIPRISHRTITAFNINECSCNEAYFKYTNAMKELQQDFFFGTSLFRKHKFAFKRLEFFDNMRLRYRLKLNMNINSLDIDYNTKYDAYSQYPLFKVQLPNFKVVCDDNEMFQISSDNIFLKILNGLQFDYSFLLTLPSPSMKLKFISYNPNYESVLQKIVSKTQKKSKSKSNLDNSENSKSNSRSNEKSNNNNNDNAEKTKSKSNSESGEKTKSKSKSKSKYIYNKDELLLLKCRCKKRPFFIPIHGYRMNDPTYDPYKLFRTHSFSAHFVLSFDNNQNASLNLDYLQPVINAFLAKKLLESSFVNPPSFCTRHFCPKLSFVDFIINLPGILVTMNKNRIFSKMNGDSTTLKFNNRRKQIKKDINENANNDQIQIQNNKRKDDANNEGKNSFSLDINGKNMKLSATMDERMLYDAQISSININYEKGFSIDVNIGTINSEFSIRIINFLAFPPIVKINTSSNANKKSTNSTSLPINLSLPPKLNTDNNATKSNSSSPSSPSLPSQQQSADDSSKSSSSYFTFAFPKYENHTELPTFDRDDQFQMLFSKRTIIIKIESATATLRFNNNKTMQSKASTIRFEQKIIPKNDEKAKKHQQSNMLDFDFNLCPPLQCISADSLSITTTRNGVQLLYLESPYFAFSKATNLTYYQIIGSTLNVCPSEEDFNFFIPTAKNFINDIYSIHKERQRAEFEAMNQQFDQQSDQQKQIPQMRAVTSSSYLRQIVLKLVGSDMTTLGTIVADDIIIQIRRSHELLEIGQFLIRKISAINELGNDSFKNVIESSKEPFLTLKYDKPPILMKNSFIQSIRIIINPFKLRIDTSYFKRLNSEFPSASLLRVFILEGTTNGNLEEDLTQSTENFESTDTNDLLNPVPRSKHSNSMTHSNSSHFNLISKLEQSDIESSGANYDDKISQDKKKKKNKDKSKTASESDTESRKSERSEKKIEKKRQKKEKKERKKEIKKLAKESLYNRALRLKNPFFCQHFNFAELPITVSFRSFDDNNSPYLTPSNLSSTTNSNSSKDSQNTFTPTNLIVDRNMQIGNLEIVDFYGDSNMLFNDISWHLRSSYFRSLSSLLLKKRKNSTMNSSPPKLDP